uniref:Sulfotransferase domain-containing protein n=1 Tax=Corethron hystrix TaxID=216773 RepID=A0A7S1BX85_9STRA|mmetsp:Transcript_42230/g.99049  ORF Transcript_42230/g.99049 Transcript_42230/m.99049 type:complete len:323 (+) Transcript_42230:292-1260(+)
MNARSLYPSFLIVVIFTVLYTFYRSSVLMLSFSSDSSSNQTRSPSASEDNISPPSPPSPSNHTRHRINTTASLNVRYGLIHMPRTAGSDFNALLALRYEGVCGNKGNSNRSSLAKKNSTKRNRNVNKIMKKDYVLATFKKCNYVAMEWSSRYWVKVFGQEDRPLELHLPCRDPLDHFLSMCNLRAVNFTCDGSWDHSIRPQIERCLGKWGGKIFAARFTSTKAFEHPNINLKCFHSPEGFNGYVDYMEARLRKKPVAREYVRHARKGLPRNKAKECLWKRKAQALLVQNFLVKKSLYSNYFQFCDKCLGSENDLLADNLLKK